MGFVLSPDPGSPPVFLGTRFWSPSKDYVVVGMLEVHFNPHWSLEGLFGIKPKPPFGFTFWTSTPRQS